MSGSSRATVLATTLAAMLAAQPGPVSADELRFETAKTYPGAAFALNSVYGAGLMSSADFNGDRRNDLVTNNCAGHGPLVLPNNGDGTFGASLFLSTAGDACAVEAGDLNGDGTPDIAAGSWDTGQVTILLGNGDFTFTRAGAYPLAGSGAVDLVFADFDRDGHRDIAGLTAGRPTVTLLLGNGDGTFSDGAHVNATGSSISFAAGDFNGDGAPDLAVSEVFPDPALSSSEVKLLLGNGDGTFGPPRAYAVGDSSEDMESADLDGDHRLDLVVANANSNDLSLLYGNGDGTFEPERRIRGRHEPDGKPGVEVADFDRDGLLDIASMETVASRVEILRGAAHRRFVPAGEYSVAGNPQGLGAADLNGDGRADLATSGYAPTRRDLGTEVSVLLGAAPAG